MHIQPRQKKKKANTYAWNLCETAQSPFVYVRRGIDRGGVGVFDKRFADDVDDEAGV